MAVKKLSQITAGNPQTIFDQIVGVVAGNADTLYPVTTVGTIPLSANLQLYISPTGSDSNTGTSISSPYATLTHAIDTLVDYDFGLVYTWTINIADGTYTENTGAPWTLPILKNIKFQGSNAGQINGNAAKIAGNVVFTHAGGFSLVGNYGVGISGGMTLKMYISGSSAMASPAGGGTYTSNATMVVDTTAQGNIFLLFFFNGSTWDNAGTTITFAGTHMNRLAWVGSACTVNLDQGVHLVFPNGYGVEVCEISAGAPVLIYDPASITGTPSYTASFSDNGTNGYLLTATGQASDFGGTVLGNMFDPTICWASFAGGTGLNISNKAGIPTTADLPNETWGVYKDTSGGGVYVAYNDEGTIKKVALV